MFLTEMHLHFTMTILLKKIKRLHLKCATLLKAQTHTKFIILVKGMMKPVLMVLSNNSDTESDFDIESNIYNKTFQKTNDTNSSMNYINVRSVILCHER